MRKTHSNRAYRRIRQTNKYNNCLFLSVLRLCCTRRLFGSQRYNRRQKTFKRKSSRARNSLLVWVFKTEGEKREDCDRESPVIKPTEQWRAIFLRETPKSSWQTMFSRSKMFWQLTMASCHGVHLIHFCGGRTDRRTD